MSQRPGLEHIIGESPGLALKSYFSPIPFLPINPVAIGRYCLAVSDPSPVKGAASFWPNRRVMGAKL